VTPTSAKDETFEKGAPGFDAALLGTSFNAA
jgi:hypothetical protein